MLHTFRHRLSIFILMNCLIALAHANRSIPEVTLSPSIGITAYPSDTLSLATLKPFLDFSRIVTAQEFNQTPYIVAPGAEHYVSAKYNKVYVKGLNGSLGEVYEIIRKGKQFTDPRTKQALGFLALSVGQGRVIKEGDPTTLELIDSKQEILKGDRVCALENNIDPAVLNPTLLNVALRGQIIDVLGGVTEIGQYMNVVLNLGQAQGMLTGSIIGIYQGGRVVKDPYNDHPVSLPEEQVGQILVYRVFGYTSIGLVTKATTAVHVGDLVSTALE